MAKILVIDDEIQILQIIRVLLERAGHDVVLTEDGNKALKLLAEHAFDLVISDLIMPEKEGIELITEIRKSWPDIKIMAISGGGKIGPSGYLKYAEKLGAQASLEKPFESHELIACVEKLLAE
jgi:DNA-binding NtrC family response regulator